MSPHDWISNVALWFLPQLADHLWQSSLLALLLYGSVSLQRGSPARTRHLLWTVALVKFAVPVAVVAFLLRTANMASYILLKLTDAGPGTQQTSVLLLKITSPVDSFTVLNPDAVPSASQHSEFYCAALVVWTIGAIILAAVQINRRRVLADLLAGAIVVEQERERRLFAHARSVIGLWRKVILLESDVQAEPVVWGTLRPVILLPAGLARRLDDDELQAVLLHELAHVKRWDNLVINTHFLLLTICWFNPVMWFLGNRLLIEREQACDEEVLKAGMTAVPYVKALLKVVQSGGGTRVAGVASIASSHLKRRLENIMAQDKLRTLSTVHRLVLFASLLIVTAGTLLPNLSSVAAAFSSDVQQEQAQLDQESEKVLQEIAGLPDQPIVAENPSTWPAQITRATFKVAPHHLLEKLDGVKLMDHSDVNAVEPTIEILNISGKRITRLVVSFLKGGKPVQERHFMASIEPGQTYTYKDELRAQLSSVLAVGKPLLTIPGGIEGVTVKVRGGNFEDESSWGEPTPKMKLNSKTTGKLTLDGGVLDSKVIEKPVPRYPMEAKGLGIKGLVVVAIIVDGEGKVISAEATSGPEALRTAAVDAAFMARFPPTRVGGVPVMVKGVLTFNFAQQR